jgi:putative membrane protein
VIVSDPPTLAGGSRRGHYDPVGIGRGRGGGEGVRTRDHLANVRTLLAFLRTGMVLLGLGLVIDKLGVLQHSVGALVGLPIAVAGWVVIGLSLVRFLFQRRAIEGADIRSFVVWDLAVVTFTAAAGLAVLIYLLLVA